ncbi:glycosyltransferase family 2 protein [Rossellomorea sp. DA94]|uniref:glycosyltransferase family 2 protein n=1 Tax=Rossellomorea sp. DA94 TaxID=3038653 RepID=UPI00244855B6|nr:glycosyltransferase family 2 protein [Rossellomorea sp. DA94]WGG45224.1 glycosyltransferase family 2 protein [Rossellomorea sp. DA94]
MRKLKLSICMMVKNEEENLKNYLPSLTPLLKDNMVELIIVDTGSTDKSKEIAFEFTSKIYEKQWNNDFSSMRNYTISKAVGEWIFIIDADEQLVNGVGLLDVLDSSKSKKFNTIQIGVRNFSYKKNNLYSTMVSPRLFRNDNEFKYDGSVHNQPKFKTPIINLTDVYLNHYGYIRDDEQLMERKFNRTSQLLKVELEKNPNNIYYRFQLAQSYGLHGETEKAFEQIKMAYSLLKDKEKTAKLYIYGVYAKLAYVLEKNEQTIDICKEGLEISEEYIDLSYYLASAYERLGMEQEATIHFIKYFELLNRLEQLEIGKSSAMEFHKTDERSVTVAAYKLVDLLLKDPVKAKSGESYISLIKDEYFKNEQLIKYFIEMKEFQNINELIYKTENNKVREVMINTTEKHKDKLPSDKLRNLHQELSKGEGIYQHLNKIRISKTLNEKINNIRLFFNKYNLRTTPSTFLEEVFQKILDLDLSLIDFGTKLSDDMLFFVCSKIMNKDNVDKFRTQIMETELKEHDYNFNRAYFVISSCYLSYIINSGMTEEDNISNYKQIFFNYIKSGYVYILNLYQEKKLRIIYKTLGNKEHAFIISMLFANQLEEMGNKRGALNYYKEAIENHSDYRRLVKEFYIKRVL